MDQYTDFLIRIGKEDIVFRHAASTVKELMEIEGEFIYDLHGFRGIKKSEIISVQLAPGQFVHLFQSKNGRMHRDLSELWNFVAEEGLRS